jgi:hypothetical protein
MQSVTSFFWYCSGADTTLLKKCPTESSKYVGIGATIFFTGIFAALAAGYSLYTVFDSVVIASIFGLLWGLMIFNLDRFIVSSMRKEGRARKELMLALPRIILAVLISIVIAKPLELKIFEKEIKPELVVMEQQKFLQQEERVRTRFAAGQDSLSQQITKLKNEIVTMASKRDELARIAQEEADGTGGTRRRNAGPIYKLKKADADRAEQELNDVDKRNTLRISELQAAFDQRQNRIAAEIGSLERARMDGPAARIEALDRLTGESSAIFWAHWFIMLLFIAIETSPVIVKLLSGKGPYDNLLKAEEHASAATEVEALATINAEAKRRTAHLPEHEQAFVKHKLDSALKES